MGDFKEDSHDADEVSRRYGCCARLIADGNQARTLYPSQRASPSGVILVTAKAQVKGKHTWTFTGRTNHRTAKTTYVVK